MKRIGVANTLTLLRIVCIPIFVVFYAVHEHGAALIIFGLASFTDLIDGTIARLRKENSFLGAVLDPIADKGLMLATFVALAVSEVVPWWFIYIILLRDGVVVAGVVFVKVKRLKIEVKAIFSSKIATLFEIVAGSMGLVYTTFPAIAIWKYPVGDLVFGTILIASVLILIATLQYVKLGLSLIERGDVKAVLARKR